MPAAQILVAEDDPDLRDLVAVIPQGAGHEVQAVGHGMTALSTLRHRRADLAVLDVSMPGLTGLQVLGELRADPETADLPVILLTACTHDDAVDAGFRAGANDDVAKPFSPREPRHRVAGLLGSPRAALPPGPRLQALHGGEGR